MAVTAFIEMAESQKFRVIIFPLIIVISSICLAEDLPLLAGEFWVELDPVIQEDENSTLSEEEASKRLLEEAQYVFSGMIFGFSFLYTPLDRTREVDEIFELLPEAEIVWGDPALTVAEVRVSGNRKYALIRYYPHDFQKSWIEYSGSNLLSRASAYGYGDVFKGHSQKLKSIGEGIREAVRSYLRKRIFNKPKEIRGRAVLSDVPYVYIDAGRYVAKVRVKLDIREIIPYKIF